MLPAEGGVIDEGAMIRLDLLPPLRCAFLFDDSEKRYEWWMVANCKLDVSLADEFCRGVIRPARVYV